MPRLGNAMLREHLYHTEDIKGVYDVTNKYLFTKEDFDIKSINEDESKKEAKAPIKGICRTKINLNTAASVTAILKNNFISLYNIQNETISDNTLELNHPDNQINPPIEGLESELSTQEVDSLDFNKMSVLSMGHENLNTNPDNVEPELLYTPNCPVENRGVQDLMKRFMGENKVLTQREYEVINNYVMEYANIKFTLKALGEEYFDVSDRRIMANKKDGLKKLREKLIEYIEGKNLSSHLEDIVDLSYNRMIKSKYFKKHIDKLTPSN